MMTDVYWPLPKSMKPKLLPCPFCGSAPSVWCFDGLVHVRCTNMLCHAEMSKPHGISEQSVKTVCANLAGRWNLRASAPLRETNKKEGK